MQQNPVDEKIKDNRDYEPHPEIRKERSFMTGQAAER